MPVLILKMGFFIKRMIYMIIFNFSDLYTIVLAN